MNSPYETLLLHVEAGVATVSLNRPDVLHALNAAMLDELEAVFRQLGDHPDIRCILLTGTGTRAFAAGADIRGLVATDQQGGHAVSLRGQEVMRQIELSPKPVIACINGVALGGGCELALACTLRLASETARLGLPEVKLGLLPGYGGTQRLLRLVGRGAALRMMLTAVPVDAKEALRIGLVDEVLAPEDLMPRALALANMIRELSPLGIAGVLQATDAYGSLDGGLAAEAHIFGRLCGTEDKHEGLTAFLEKRKPIWSAR